MKVVREMRETGETTEDRMSSAAETRSTNRESASQAEHAAAANRELVSAGVTTATEATATGEGQPQRCDIDAVITATMSHRRGSEAGAEASDAGLAGSAGLAGDA